VSDRRFPIQGGLSVTREAAERAYLAYAKFFGTNQSLDRLGERGGFGLREFVHLFDGRNPSEPKDIDKMDDYRFTWVLREADIRVTPAPAAAKKGADR